MSEITNTYDLLDALDGAVSGDEIILANATTFDLTPYKDLVIKSGVTLRGNSKFSSNKPVLRYERTFKDKTYAGMLRVEEGTRDQRTVLDQLILDGTHPKPIGPNKVQNAIRIEGPYVTISNCEIQNWLKWGIHILNVHNQLIYNTEFKNIWYDDGKGYGYGIWGDGTNADSILAGSYPAINDITKVVHCSFTDMRNGYDCSQPGNSIILKYNRFGRFYQAALDHHRTYSSGNVYIENNIFSGQGGQATIRIFQIEERLVVANNIFWRDPRALYIDKSSGIGNEWINAYNSNREFPDPINVPKFTIFNNEFRVDY